MGREYWLGLICTALALILRLTTALAPGGIAISYTTFLHGAALFFLLTIVSWYPTAKS